MRSQALAIIESILFLLQDNLRVIVAEQALSQLTLSGGLSALEGLCQKMANLSQLPVQQLQDQETTARGIAWLASSGTQPWPVKVAQRFEPYIDAPLQARYTAFRQQLAALMEAS